MTVVNDPAKALALDQELSTLLAKGAIEPVDPLLHPRGFYSRYCLVKKKEGRFRPILYLRGLNRFLKVLPFPDPVAYSSGLGRCRARPTAEGLHCDRQEYHSECQGTIYQSTVCQ